MRSQKLKRTARYSRDELTLQDDNRSCRLVALCNNLCSKVVRQVGSFPKNIRLLQAEKIPQGRKVLSPAQTSGVLKSSCSPAAHRGLVNLLIAKESEFDANAVSNHSAVGLMQLMPETATSLHVTNRFDPYQSVRGGCDYLVELTKRFNGDVYLVLAAYNAGPTKIDRLLEKHRIQGTGLDRWQKLRPHLPRETRDYVTKITTLLAFDLEIDAAKLGAHMKHVTLALTQFVNAK